MGQLFVKHKLNINNIFSSFLKNQQQMEDVEEEEEDVFVFVQGERFRVDGKI